jgi:hypothetical protein
MTKIISSLFLAILLGLCLQVAPAQAQLSRTAVSAARGNDANAANDQGEITVLDPGGYGGLTITKSINIVNDGVGEASILVSGGGVGITINAGAAAYINLRGITIQGIGFGGGRGWARRHDARPEPHIPEAQAAETPTGLLRGRKRS